MECAFFKTLIYFHNLLLLTLRKLLKCTLYSKKISAIHITIKQLFIGIFEIWKFNTIYFWHNI